MLLVTKGRSLTKAFAKVEGGIPYLFAKPTYLSIAFSPLSVWCLEKRLGHRVYLAFFGLIPPMY